MVATSEPAAREFHQNVTANVLSSIGRLGSELVHVALSAAEHINLQGSTSKSIPSARAASTQHFSHDCLAVARTQSEIHKSALVTRQVPHVYRNALQAKQVDRMTLTTHHREPQASIQTYRNTEYSSLRHSADDNCCQQFPHQVMHTPVGCGSSPPAAPMPPSIIDRSQVKQQSIGMSDLLLEQWSLPSNFVAGNTPSASTVAHRCAYNSLSPHQISCQSTGSHKGSLKLAKRRRRKARSCVPPAAAQSGRWQGQSAESIYYENHALESSDHCLRDVQGQAGVSKDCCHDRHITEGHVNPCSRQTSKACFDSLNATGPQLLSCTLQPQFGEPLSCSKRSTRGDMSLQDTYKLKGQVLGCAAKQAPGINPDRKDGHGHSGGKVRFSPFESESSSRTAHAPHISEPHSTEPFILGAPLDQHDLTKLVDKARYNPAPVQMGDGDESLSYHARSKQARRSKTDPRLMCTSHASVRTCSGHLVQAKKTSSERAADLCHKTDCKLADAKAAVSRMYNEDCTAKSHHQPVKVKRRAQDGSPAYHVAGKTVPSRSEQLLMNRDSAITTIDDAICLLSLAAAEADPPNWTDDESDQSSSFECTEFMIAKL